MNVPFFRYSLLIASFSILVAGCAESGDTENARNTVSGVLQEKLDTIVTLTHFSSDINQMRRLEDTLVSAKVSDSNTYSLPLEISEPEMTTLRVGSFVIFDNKLLLPGESPKLSGSITDIEIHGAPSLEKQIAFAKVFMGTEWAKLANSQRNNIGTDATMDWFESERKRAHSWIDSAFGAETQNTAKQYLHVLADFFISDRKLSAISRFKYKGESGLLSLDFCSDLPWNDSLASECYLYYHLLAKVPFTYTIRNTTLAFDTTSMTPEELGADAFLRQPEEKLEAIDAFIPEGKARQDAYFKLAYSDILTLATEMRTSVTVSESYAEVVFKRVDMLDQFIESLPQRGVSPERVEFLKTLRNERF